MWWLQDTNQSSADNLNNVRCEATRHFRKNKKEYLKAKIDELETISKLKNVRDLYRGITDFKKGYQSSINMARDEKIDMLTDCHSILARRWNHFSRMLNVHAVSNVNQTEMYLAEPLVSELSAFEVEVAIEKLQRSPSIDQFPAELIKAGHRTIRSEISKLLNSIWNKEELPEEWKESIIVLMYKKYHKTDFSNYRVISLLSTT